MIQLTLEEVTNYQVSNMKDLQTALNEISKQVILSERLRMEFLRLFTGRMQTPYKHVIRMDNETHGFSATHNHRNELILTHYTFKKGA